MRLLKGIAGDFVEMGMLAALIAAIAMLCMSGAIHV
jgi:hypothetical protein